MEMNADEFITAINRQVPSGLPHADREFLRRYQIVLGSGPYYNEHIRNAINLLSAQHEILHKFKQELKQTLTVTGVRPQVAISQVVVIHNLDAKQCHRIRDALIQTQLINFEGSIFISFSPYTHRTIDSLPTDAFSEADYHMEYSVFEKVDSQGKTSPFAIAPNPVVFIKDIKPTLVQLSFVLGGKRQPGISPGALLPSPLYRAFLDVSADSSQAIMDFMNTHKVYIFPMSWDYQDLSDYISGNKRTMRLKLATTQNQLKESWSAEQQNMRGILMAAAQDRLRQVVLPPIFPVCEEAMVEWRDISGYFSADLVQTKVPRDARQVLFEFKEDKTADKLVRIRRYYGWLEYMWAELADDIYKGKAMLICERCGRIISPGTHGKRKRFCSLSENPECYKARKRKYVGISRKGLAD